MDKFDQAFSNFKDTGYFSLKEARLTLNQLRDLLNYLKKKQEPLNSAIFLYKFCLSHVELSAPQTEEIRFVSEEQTHLEKILLELLTLPDTWDTIQLEGIVIQAENREKMSGKFISELLMHLKNDSVLKVFGLTDFAIDPKVVSRFMEENKSLLSLQIKPSFIDDTFIPIFLSGLYRHPCLETLGFLGYPFSENTYKALCDLLDDNYRIKNLLIEEPPKENALLVEWHKEVLSRLSSEGWKKRFLLQNFKDWRKLELLEKTGLLSELTLDMLKNNPMNVAVSEAFSFHEAKKIVEENFNEFDSFLVPKKVPLIAWFLSFFGILTQENFDIIQAHSEPFGCAKVLVLLNHAGILTFENRAAIQSYPQLEPLVDAFEILHREGILTQANFLEIQTHSEPIALAKVFKFLHREGILTTENRVALNSDLDIQTSSTTSLEIEAESDLLQLLLLNFSFLLLLCQSLSRPDNEVAVGSLNNNEAAVSSGSFNNIALLLEILYERKILTQDNFDRIRYHPNIKSMTTVLKTLNEKWGFTQEDFLMIYRQVDIKSVVHVLQSLDNSKILTQGNIVGLLTRTDLGLFADIFKLFSMEGILTQEIFEMVQSHSNLKLVSETSDFLYVHEMLTPVNLEIILPDTGIWGISSVYALYNLSRARILTQKNLEAIRLYHEKSLLPLAALSLSLSLLYKAEVLTQEYFELLLSHPNPQALYTALASLEAAGILNRENFEAVQSQRNLWDIAEALSKLYEADILTQKNLTALLAQNSLLMPGIWDQIPAKILTLDTFNELLRRACKAQPDEQIQAYINYLLISIAPFNNRESTHITSVHPSASESATRLLIRYGSVVEAILEEERVELMNRFLKCFSDYSGRNKIVKRCIERITAFDYTFSDPTSEVSVHQLLLLIFFAVSDKDTRYGSEINAFDQLIEGFYEIQRGYNLSENGEDDGGEDKPISAAGTFNKLIEKLQGIHPDCEVHFVTSKTVSFTLVIVVRETVMRYLSQLASPANAVDFLAFTHLIRQIKDRGIEVIWDKIKDSVTNDLFKEFANFYKDPKNDYFMDLIEEGRYTLLSDEMLNSFQGKIQNSSGYHQYCSQMLRQGSLFLSSVSRDRLPNASNQSTIRFEEMQPRLLSL